jgi:hypothetical protein
MVIDRRGRVHGHTVGCVARVAGVEDDDGLQRGAGVDQRLP